MGEKFEKIIKLALQRGILFPSSEIYANAPSGLFDYGPNGAPIRRKIVDFWRKELVQKENMLEIDGAKILPKDVFEASGHLKNFVDPIVYCKKCGSHFRADKLLESKAEMHISEGTPVEKIKEALDEHKIVCPGCKGPLGEVSRFNMMLGVKLGPKMDSECFLRPEACQSIFLSYMRLFKTMRVKFPFGIAQAGEAFRNEISPRNFIMRGREFQQMECEIFFDPKEIDNVERFSEVEKYKIRVLRQGKDKIEEITAGDLVKKKLVSGKIVAYYMARAQQMYEKMGVPRNAMQYRQLDDDERAFYAKESWDFEVNTDLGWQELFPINYRTDYDLSGHAKGSGKELYGQREDGSKFIPHVLELSIGVDRSLYVVLEHSYKEEKERNYLDMNPRLAPVEIGVLPLMKKDGLADKAREIYETLIDNGFDAYYDHAGSIGKRYARLDEIGCPFMITVDYETLEKGDKKDTVTLRERTSTKQKRVPIKDLPELLWKLLKGIEKF
ncbi:MAG: glycine--tRNA ligase [Candidatus Diapherotrites archaeon]|nr:glycine--tRNA ligase [Candidatus Diapherotrites archaeon]